MFMFYSTDLQNLPFPRMFIVTASFEGDRILQWDGRSVVVIGFGVQGERSPIL